MDKKESAVFAINTEAPNAFSLGFKKFYMETWMFRVLKKNGHLFIKFLAEIVPIDLSLHFRVYRQHVSHRRYGLKYLLRFRPASRFLRNVGVYRLVFRNAVSTSLTD